VKGSCGGDVVVAKTEGKTSEGGALRQRRDLFTPGHAALAASGRNQVRAGLEEKKEPTGWTERTSGPAAARQGSNTARWSKPSRS
jgi:hypothetical protein